MTANLNARLGLTLSYTNEEGGTSTASPIAIASHYQSQSHGTIDVPDTQAMDTEYSIPFGTVDAGAALMIIENRTGQDLEVKVNDQNVGTHHHDIPVGGVFVLGGPSPSAAHPLLSAVVKTTAIQSGAGLVAYRVFGDPV
jgi:hypothetical protein